MNVTRLLNYKIVTSEFREIAHGQHTIFGTKSHDIVKLYHKPIIVSKCNKLKLIVTS